MDSVIQAWQPSHLYLLQEFFTDKHWAKLAKRILLEFPPPGKRQKAFLEKLAPAHNEREVKGDWTEFLSLLYRTLTSHKRHSKFTFEFFAAHPDTPDSVIEELIAERQGLETIAKRKNLKSDWLEELLGLREESINWNLLEHQNLTTDQCADLYGSLKQEKELWHFARWANAPEEIFDKLNQSGIASVRRCLAENRHLNSALLLRLVEDDDQRVSCNAAVNPALDKKQLTLLSQKEFPSLVVSGLAKNPNATARVLQQLYDRLETGGSDPRQAYFLEQQIVRNNNCSPELLSAIFESLCKRKPFSRVTAGRILENRASTKRLLLDCYHRVTKSAADHIFESGMGIDWALSSKRVLAANPNCPLEILHELASSSKADVRALVAKNESTSSELLDSFKAEKSRVVLEGLVANKMASPELLAAIWRKKANQTQNMAQLIYANPNCDAQTKASINSRFKFGNKYEMCEVYAAELGVKFC